MKSCRMVCFLVGLRVAGFMVQLYHTESVGIIGNSRSIWKELSGSR
jgi:hypothetical protein